MSEPRKTDDSRLNALADGELDSIESQALLNDLEQNPEMHRALCDIHLLKDMMHVAYPQPHKTTFTQPGRKGLFAALAASIVFLAVGFISGKMFFTDEMNNHFALSQVEPSPNKVVLFLGFDDDEKFIKAMDQAETIMQQYQGKTAQVDIVASGSGLDFLRTSTTPHAERIRNLAATYSTLDFIACNQTIAKLKKEGKQVDIVNEAHVAPSAVQFVVDRLQQGWSYIEI